MVRERPILFSAPMVRALLDGSKTQTRRVVKLPGWSLSGCDVEIDADGAPCIIAAASRCLAEIPCPYGAPGDRLWVRETWTADFEWIPEPGHSRLLPWHRVPAGWRGAKNAQRVYYAADDLEAEVYANEDGTCDLVTTGERAGTQRWAPSIFMPRWACRIALEITDVRVERLQAMATREESGDESDALAEGIVCEPDHIGPRYGLPGAMTNRTAYAAFARLWDSLNAPRGYGWTVNPWVWALTFRRVPA